AVRPAPRGRIPAALELLFPPEIPPARPPEGYAKIHTLLTAAGPWLPADAVASAPALVPRAPPRGVLGTRHHPETRFPGRQAPTNICRIAVRQNDCGRRRLLVVCAVPFDLAAWFPEPWIILRLLETPCR